VFFSDGTRKILGGTNAFVLPLRSTLQDADLKAFCRNEKTNGWYCTQIIDKAENTITITYREYDPPNKPYAGSILSITDQFNRITNFNIWTEGPDNTSQNFYEKGLLKEIVYPDGSKDTFTYTVDPKAYVPTPFYGTINSVMLWKVKDPMDLETLYDYQEWTLQSGLSRAYLNKIFYPTGAVAEFVHEHIDEVSGNTVRPKGDVVKERKLYVGTNVLIWSWDRKTYQNAIGPRLEGESVFDVGFPVVTKDPYGIQEVHCFKGSDINDCGAEYYVFRLKPGVILSEEELKNLIQNPETQPGTPKAEISFIQKKYWRVPANNPRDGIFLKRVIEKDSSGTTLVVKTTKRQEYDGWGHFGRTTFYQGEEDNPSGDYKEIVNSNYLDGFKPNYQSPSESLTYNLTLLDTISRGGMGTYKYEKRFYSGTGFLTEIREYTSTTSQTGDYRSTSVSYDSSGNPQTITYSNSNGLGGNFTQNLTWEGGVLKLLIGAVLFTMNLKDK
jgi:hypothetical protein